MRETPGDFLPCSQPRCDTPATCKGLCRTHYSRLRKHGDPGKVLVIYADMRREGLQRFWSQVVIGPVTPEMVDGAPCWFWQGEIVGNGYGYALLGGKRIYVHRLAWELLRGPIADDLQLDHVCHNEDAACHAGDDCPHRRCVNPAHLEPVTGAVNNARRVEHKTHCVNGHEYTPESTYTDPKGARACRVCKRDIWRRWYERSRAARKEAS